MTIPNLVQSYQNRAWNTADTVFQRKLTEALKIMNTQGTLAGYSSTEAFVNELSKHLKITKTCTNNLTSCFEKEVTVDGQKTTIKDVQTASDLGKDWRTNVVGFQLANGVNGLLAYNPDCTQDEYSNTVTGSDCLGVVYDTSAYTKPNEHLKDIRTNGNVNKLGDAWLCVRFADHCWTFVNEITPMRFLECTGGSGTANSTTPAGEEAQKLGIQNCYYENDYWAGAVKQCGGTKNMPTMAQLAQLADQIYGESGIGAQERREGLTIADQTLFDTLVSKSPYSSSFYVWSGEEYSSYNAYNRLFYATDSNYSYPNRNHSSRLAVCLGD